MGPDRFADRAAGARAEMSPPIAGQFISRVKFIAKKIGGQIVVQLSGALVGGNLEKSRFG